MTDYKSIELAHRDGIREIRFHSDGGPLLWNEAAHREAALAFHEGGSDPDIQVVLITGTGDNFCAGTDQPNSSEGRGRRSGGRASGCCRRW